MKYTSSFGKAVYAINNVLDGLSLVYNGASATKGNGTGSTPVGAPGCLGWGWTLMGPWRFFASLSSVGNTGPPTSGSTVQFNDGLGSFELWSWNSTSYTATFTDNYTVLAVLPGIGWSLTFKDQTQLFFNTSGQLLSQVDSNGNQLNYTYSSGNLYSVVDQQGRGYYFTAYGSGNQPTTIYCQSPTGGKLLQLAYTAYSTTGHGSLYYLSSVTVSVNSGTTLQYSLDYVYNPTLDANLLKSVTNPQESKPSGVNPNPTQQVNYTYYSSGQVNVERQTYVPASTSPSYPESVQNTVTYLYQTGSPYSTMTIFEQDGVTGAVRTTVNTYNYLRNLISSVDALDNAQAYEYNGPNPYLVTTVIDPNLNRNVTEYDSSGNPVSVTNAQNNTTKYVYASAPGLANLVVQVIQPTLTVGGVAANYVSTRSYDSRRNLVQTQDSLGNTNFFQVNTMPVFNSSTTANFTQPAASAITSVALATTTGLAPGQLLYIVSGGFYGVVSVTATTVVLKNLGSAGNANSGTTILAGSVAVNTIPAANNTTPAVNTTTTANFTQPAVDSAVSVTLGSTSGMTPGQLIYIVIGGFYRVSSISSSIQANLINLGYPGNAAPTTSISSGSAVCASCTNTNGWVTSVQDANGNRKQIAYTASGPSTNGGNVQSTTVEGPAGPLTATICYDLYDNPISITDASGNTVWSQRDWLRRPLQTTDSLGTMAQWIYPYLLLTQSIGPSNAASAGNTLINTTTTASFTQPAVNSTVSVAFASTSGMVAGQLLYVGLGGIYSVSSVTDGTHAVLANTGFAGNAAAASSISSGSSVSSQNFRSQYLSYDIASRLIQALLQTDSSGIINAAARVTYSFTGFSTLAGTARPVGGSNYQYGYDLIDRPISSQFNCQKAFDTATAGASSFTQPAVNSTVSVTLARTSGMAPGQLVYVATRGYYSVSSVTDGTHAVLTNLGYAGNASPATTIQPGSPVANSLFNTTTSSGFTQPAAGGNVTLTFATTTGMAAGQLLYVATGGIYSVTSVTDGTHAVLTNPGYSGNASSGTNIAGGSAVADSLYNTTTGASFTQPSVTSSVLVTLASTSAIAPGQVLYLKVGGFYSVSSISSGTQAYLTNLGYTGNAPPGATIASGSWVTNTRFLVTTTAYSKTCYQNTVNTAAGILRTTTLDSICRLTQIATQAELRRYTYDALNRRVSATSGSLYASPNLAQGAIFGTGQLAQTKNYGWDAGSRLQYIQQPNGLFLRYAHDKVGNITQRISIDGSITYSTHFKNYQLAAVTYSPSSGSAQTFSYSYSTGRLAAITYPASIAATFALDKGDRLTRLQYANTGTGANIQSFQYRHDNSGNRIQIVEQTGTATPITYSLGYDWFDRLNSVKLNGSDLSAYAFDPNDNRTQHIAYGSPTTTYGYNHNLADQLLSTAAATSSGSNALEAFVWDPDGRMASRTLASSAQVTAYAWTTMNKLGMFSVNGAVQESDGYSDDGLRNTRSDGTNYYTSGGTSIYETRPTGPVSFIAADQIRGIDPGGTGSPYFYLTDHLGSVRLTVNASGAIQTTNAYNEFGLLTSTTAPGSYTDRSLTYVGAFGVRNEPTTHANQPSGSVNGLLLMGQRWYDPALGRFLSPDPLGALNSYSYATNNPLNRMDPGGLEDFSLDGPDYPIAASKSAKTPPPEIIRPGGYQTDDGTYTNYVPYPRFPVDGSATGSGSGSGRAGGAADLFPNPFTLAADAVTAAAAEAIVMAAAYGAVNAVNEFAAGFGGKCPTPSPAPPSPTVVLGLGHHGHGLLELSVLPQASKKPALGRLVRVEFRLFRSLETDQVIGC